MSATQQYEKQEAGEFKIGVKSLLLHCFKIDRTTKDGEDIHKRRRGIPAGNSPYLHDGAHAVVGADPHDLAVATMEDGERRAHPFPLVTVSGIDGVLLGFAFLSVSVFTANF